MTHPALISGKEAPNFNASDLAAARQLAEQTGAAIMDVLAERISWEDGNLVEILARSLGYQTIDMATMQKLPAAFDLLPYAQASRKGCVAFRSEHKIIFVFSDPFDTNLTAWAQQILPFGFEERLASHSEISTFLAQNEETLRAIDGALIQSKQVNQMETELEDLSLQSISADTSPVVRLVNSTIYDALKVGASDIHLEALASGMAIKYRVDGVLSSVGTVDGVAMAEQTISRIKVMAELDIAEKRVPQDGRFKLSVKGRAIDFRVSIMPSIIGEDAVLRILDKDALVDKAKGLRLDDLGFDADSKRLMRKLSNEPYGMVLVTGPTGSGKTTTLYAAISEINHGLDKIITIEDPVEYQLPGVLQIPVNEKKGLTFAKGLRSILRHDPDKILIGEIRDSETAQIAVQSALTGHLVFTTVHANNVFDVIGRFMHMGVDPYSFVSALNGILAQRLLRVVCTQCKEAYTPDEQLLADSGISQKDAGHYRFVIGRGCGHCRGTGYKGRKAIAEILHLNDEIRELIISREPIRKIKDAACNQGTRFLRDAALELVRNGETSLQEINRVTFVA